MNVIVTCYKHVPSHISFYAVPLGADSTVAREHLEKRLIPRKNAAERWQSKGCWKPRKLYAPESLKFPRQNFPFGTKSPEEVVHWGIPTYTSESRKTDDSGREMSNTCRAKGMWFLLKFK